MSDELAVKIFATVTRIEDEHVARQVMYHYGFAAKYLEIAEVLQPLFQEAYEDGIEDGIDYANFVVDNVRPDQRSPNYNEGANDALALVKESLSTEPVDGDVILEFLPPGNSIEGAIATFLLSVAPSR